MAAVKPRPPDEGLEPHKMDQSAYQIIDGNGNEAYAKPNKTALHSKMSLMHRHWVDLPTQSKVIPRDGRQVSMSTESSMT
jgi:hypothetical protein